MSDPLVGRVLLGRYRVVRALAKGGMGAVYLARTEGAAGFVRPVVIKRILPEIEQQDIVGMFVREARILANLRHPSIAGIVDFAEEDGAHLMVLEYVHGYHLGQWRRHVRETRGRFDAEVAVHVVLSVLDALAYAHRLERPDGSVVEVIHRDVSPANVMVDSDGQVKLLDFGIARMSGGDTGLYKTEALMVKGKLPYVPPEQLGGAPPSAGGDVYACGVLLHELLVGVNELRGADVTETVGRVLSRVPSPVPSVRDDVSEALDAVVARALHKDPDQRYATAKDFAEGLRGARELSTDEARARLNAMIREDYPAMPRVVGVDPLEARERAWMTSPDEPGAGEVEPVAKGTERRSDSDMPPTEAEAVEVASTHRAGRAWIPWAVAGALLVAAAGVAALAYPFTRPEPEPLYVVQQPAPAPGARGVGRAGEPSPAASEAEASQAEASQAEAAQAEAAQAEPSEAEPSPGGGRTPREPRRRPQPAAGESLAASFARHGGEVESCLRSHASGIEGSPELAVHFEVGRDGQVRRARVLPAAVASTTLGGCLRGVAQRVRFAPQERDDLSFRIPITVERR